MTFEQVERLKDRANVTWEEAKAALEACGGDLLEAVLLLERQGKTPPPPGGFYSTRAGAAGQPPPVQRAPAGQKAGGERWKARLRDLLEGALGILRHCTVNQLEVRRHGQLMSSIPVVIVILLLVVAFWIVAALLLIGLPCGCRYSFSGPDLNAAAINRVMERGAEAVQDAASRVREEFSRQRRK